MAQNPDIVEPWRKSQWFRAKVYFFECAPWRKSQILIFTNILKPKEDYFDVAAHGTAQMICFGGKTPNMGPSLLADLIKRYPTYHGEKIRLLSCNTGNTSVLEKWEYCFAEELSNIMGVTVEAPDDFMYYRNDGTFFVGVPQKTDLVSFTPNQRG